MTRALFERVIPTCVAIAGSVLSAPMAADAAEPIDFIKQIQPIFAKHCVECHGADTQDGGIRWDRRTSVMRGGDSGVPPIVAGQPDASDVIRRLVTDDEEERMPAEADPLAKHEVELVRQWIAEGAKWPEDASAERRTHWAYIAPKRAALPRVKQQNWPKGAIDRFVLARLEAERLRPSAAVDRARLIRRVSLDLTGLPPTIDEVDAFLADKSPTAYEKVVDRLLASPRYGEHWARPWLDMARYADSNGYQRDGFKVMWAYRDWVINALNDDMPFDQFSIEQIAGDLLPQPTLEQRVATGFHRCPTVNVEAGVNQEENRVNQVFDRVNTTGTVWLGTTVECSQCHNHKYDPFTQREYYQLFAFFNRTPMETKFRNPKKDTAAVDFIDAPSVTIPLAPIAETQRSELEKQYAQIEKQWKVRRDLVVAGFEDWEKKATAHAQASAEWKPLVVESFKSEQGADHELTKDGAVLVSGENPDKDVYKVAARTNQEAVTAVRIEALRDRSLNKNGPGRRPGRPNFVLTEFTVDLLDDADRAGKRVKLLSPQSSYHAENFHVGRAIDGNDTTGWAIHSEFGKSHWATFRLDEPIGDGGETRLRFSLRQNYGGQRTIGKLRLSATTADPSTVGLPDYITRILRRKPADRAQAERESLVQYLVQQDPTLRKMSTSMEKIKKDMIGGKSASPAKSTTSLVMVDLDQPRMTNLFRRGNFETKGIQVKPNVPESLHPMPVGAPANRLGLARWLVDRKNPLVARVTVNRWWAEFFGQGIVATPEDFGTQGARPTHPKVLDWLAVEFMEQGWSPKHIHKLIVMSATYRQSSRVSPALLAKDPKNQLYARGPRIRLAAETIRDNALAISGLLAAKVGGPPVYPPQPAGVWNVTGKVDNTYRTSKGEDRFRRGVYVVWRRSSPYPSFVSFDAPDRSTCVVQRARTNTPLMALALMNDPVYVEFAKSLAGRILRESPSAETRERIRFGFRLALAREPEAAELDRLVAIHVREVKLNKGAPAAANKQLAGTTPPDGIDANHWAAWYFIATLLLNLDETITKG